MLMAEENDLLCRVEGDAPMGAIMRRHWLPACMSEEVAAPDGVPVRVRLLGEDLVAFRDTRGVVGVVGEHCPHRGASLALGRNEECGLRCLYHGWKVDVQGTVVETPSEPPTSTLGKRVRHPAYPTREAGGFVRVYMGQPETMRDFEPPARTDARHQSRDRQDARRVQRAQILKARSTRRTATLHSTDMTAHVDGAGRWQRLATSSDDRRRASSRATAACATPRRRPVERETHDYVRITCFVAPSTALIPPNNVHRLANVNVPMDDTNTAIAWSDDGPGIDSDAWRAFCHARVGVDLDANYRPLRVLANNYLQDRDAMERGDHTGIPGIPTQDMAMWETMGPITDRSRERLGASDTAIVRFRKIMVDAAERVARGEPAIGTTVPRVPLAEVRSFEGVVPKSVDWRTLR
jgi:phthalate 4,5-dioxygenase oxygenase subunit